jgi:hypothetical protein
MSSLVVLQSVESVSAQGARQDSDITKNRLEWLVQNVRHLVLKVLRCHEWVE